ncbi:MAG TPA: TonB family protein [Longimicrobium sp.]|nr:TonB family protein [Longimicrobium sp.]
MNRMRRLPLVALAFLAAQACATAGPPVTRDDSPSAVGSEATRGRSCRTAASPAQLPAAGQLVDDAAFRSAAARLWTAAGRPDGHLTFSIRHSPDGMQVRRALIDSNVAPALADTLQRLLFAYRREMPPAPHEWGVRLRVDLGEAVGLRVARGQTCTPSPRDWEYRAAGNRFDVRERSAVSVGNALVTDPAVAWVHVWVDERGTVTDARVERGPGGRQADQRLLYYVRTLAFVPATADGYPVPGELTLPVRLSMSN